MRVWAGVVAAVVACWSQTVGAAPDDAATSARAAFERYDQGWRTFDVDKVANAFSPDFERTNKIGLRFDVKATLRAFLTRMFGDAETRAGNPVRW